MRDLQSSISAACRARMPEFAMSLNFRRRRDRETFISLIDRGLVESPGPETEAIGFESVLEPDDE